MKYKIVSIYDSVADCYQRPFFVASVAVAVRSFTDECSNPDSMLNKHPKDYHLFVIGEFDDETANLTPVKPMSYGSAQDFIAKAGE
jgi:hypothetical protein